MKDITARLKKAIWSFKIPDQRSKLCANKVVQLGESKVVPHERN